MFGDRDNAELPDLTFGKEEQIFDDIPAALYFANHQLQIIQ